MITITLPFPPSVNHYYRRVGNKTLISAEGRAYIRTVADHAMAFRWDHELTGRLAVSITLHPPDRRRRDVDNSLKPLLDALTKAGAWIDDSQIDDLSVRRREVMGPGIAIITIEPLTPESDSGTV